MLHRTLADIIVLIHLAFVLFVVLGGWLWLRWRWMPCLHLPAAAWGALIEMAGWICPLTPLEVRIRQAGGAAGYEGGFIERYVVPILYPDALTRGVQIALAVTVCAANILIYAYVWRLKRRPLPPAC